MLGAAALEPELERLARAADAGVVVLDLRALDFLDSSGLRLVVMADSTAARRGPPARARPRRGAGSARVRDHAHERAADLRRRPEDVNHRAGSTASVGREAGVRARQRPDSAARGPPRARRPRRPRCPRTSSHDLRLLVSELVTNAVRHAELDADEAIRLSRRGVRRRPARRGPRPRAAASTPDEPRPDRRSAAGGWGLYLVETLADRWGVDRDGHDGVVRARRACGSTARGPRRL